MLMRRYLPEGMKLTNEKGEFLPVVSATCIAMEGITS